MRASSLHLLRTGCVFITLLSLLVLGAPHSLTEPSEDCEEFFRRFKEGQFNTAFYSPSENLTDGRFACRSKTEQKCFRHVRGHLSDLPSPVLVQKLKHLKAYQRYCDSEEPLAKLPGKIMRSAKKNKKKGAALKCRYLIFRPPQNADVADEILGLVSSFAYALLTNRIFLISQSYSATSARAKTLINYLCEPWEGVSWKLPPSKAFDNFVQSLPIFGSELDLREEEGSRERGGEEETGKESAALEGWEEFERWREEAEEEKEKEQGRERSAKRVLLLSLGSVSSSPPSHSTSSDSHFVAFCPHVHPFVHSAAVLIFSHFDQFFLPAIFATLPVLRREMLELFPAVQIIKVENERRKLVQNSFPLGKSLQENWERGEVSTFGFLSQKEKRKERNGAKREGSSEERSQEGGEGKREERVEEMNEQRLEFGTFRTSFFDTTEKRKEVHVKDSPAALVFDERRKEKREEKRVGRKGLWKERVSALSSREREPKRREGTKEERQAARTRRKLLGRQPKRNKKDPKALRGPTEASFGGTSQPNFRTRIFATLAPLLLLPTDDIWEKILEAAWVIERGKERAVESEGEDTPLVSVGVRAGREDLSEDNAVLRTKQAIACVLQALAAADPPTRDEGSEAVHRIRTENNFEWKRVDASRRTAEASVPFMLIASSSSAFVATLESALQRQMEAPGVQESDKSARTIEAPDVSMSRPVEVRSFLSLPSLPTRTGSSQPGSALTGFTPAVSVRTGPKLARAWPERKQQLFEILTVGLADVMLRSAGSSFGHVARAYWSNAKTFIVNYNSQASFTSPSSSTSSSFPTCATEDASSTGFEPCFRFPPRPYLFSCCPFPDSEKSLRDFPSRPSLSSTSFSLAQNFCHCLRDERARLDERALSSDRTSLFPGPLESCPDEPSGLQIAAFSAEFLESALSEKEERTEEKLSIEIRPANRFPYDLPENDKAIGDDRVVQKTKSLKERNGRSKPQTKSRSSSTTPELPSTLDISPSNPSSSLSSPHSSLSPSLSSSPLPSLDLASYDPSECGAPIILRILSDLLTRGGLTVQYSRILLREKVLEDPCNPELKAKANHASEHMGHFFPVACRRASLGLIRVMGGNTRDVFLGDLGLQKTAESFKSGSRSGSERTEFGPVLGSGSDEWDSNLEEKFGVNSGPLGEAALGSALGQILKQGSGGADDGGSKGGTSGKTGKCAEVPCGQRHFSSVFDFLKYKYLVPAYIQEQLSQARRHFADMILLAKETNRVIVLPRVGQSFIKADQNQPFCSYFDDSSIGEFVPWVSFDFFLVLVRVLSLLRSRPFTPSPTVPLSLSPSPSSLFLASGEIETRECLTRPPWKYLKADLFVLLNGVDFSEESTVTVGGAGDDALSRYIESANGPHDVVVVGNRFVGDLFPKPQILEVKGKLLNYSLPNWKLADIIASEMGHPYIAVHFRAEMIVGIQGRIKSPGYLKRCGEAAVRKIKEVSQILGVDRAYISTDVSLYDDVKWKSIQFKNEEAKETMREMMSQVNLKMIENFPHVGHISDNGQMGIIDKLVCVKADTFVAAESSCGGHHNFDNAIEGYRRAFNRSKGVRWTLES